MATNAMISIMVDPQVRDEASEVFAEAGLTVSEVVRLLLLKTAQDKVMPFDPLVPNQETIAAMEEAQRGELIEVGPIENLMADLYADD